MALKYLYRCEDHCRMYLVERKNPRPHFGALRCRQHGFIKWLNESQYRELHEIMYPTIHMDDLL